MYSIPQFARAFALVIVSFLAGCAGPKAVEPANDAERDYQKILAIHRQRQSPYPSRSDDDFNWLRDRFAELHNRGIQFMKTYPGHSRRWDVLVLLQYGRDHRINVLPDGKSRQLVSVRESREAWEQKYYPMLEELLAARDASADARRTALEQLIDFGAGSVHSGTLEESLATTRKTLGFFETLRTLVPRSPMIPGLYHRTAKMLNAVDPEQSRAFAQDAISRHGSQDRFDVLVREKMAGQLRLIEAQAKPSELLWTDLAAMEPSLRDSSKYRGKLILVAMMPVSWDGYTARLEKLYADHHGGGLEIIQVAYRNTVVSAPPEQREKSAMEEFVAGKKWPWPVIWDAGGHFGGFAGKWGQNTLPAYFLIGRDGRIVNDRTRSSLSPELIILELAKKAGR